MVVFEFGSPKRSMSCKNVEQPPFEMWNLCRTPRCVAGQRWSLIPHIVSCGFATFHLSRDRGGEAKTCLLDGNVLIYE